MSASNNAADRTAPTGFRKPVQDTNATFRTCLSAMSRPGTILPLQTQVVAPAPMFATTAAVLLTLADFEATVWLDAPLAERPEVADYLRFQTGTRIVEAHEDCDFAVIASPASMPRVSTFRGGTPDYPDRSTTVILQVSDLLPSGLSLRGPGISDIATFSAAPVPDDWTEQLRANRDSFPCGVDFVFVSDSEIAALPRSVVVVGG
jgi:alpha-D-ribose 1-methylphosphonate 5-triphosphate synthase subunit PhnH